MRFFSLSLIPVIAAGFAVVRAVMEAADPAAATKELLELIAND